MAKIIFMCELEEGHLLPTFGLAHSLKKRGHDVSYLSVADNEQLIQEQGFQFHAVLENLYPKGLRKIQKNHSIDPDKTPLGEPGAYLKHHVQAVVTGAYDTFIREMNADLYIVSFYLRFDMLMFHYKYNINSVIFSPVMHGPEKTIESDSLFFLHNLELAEKCLLADFFSEKNIRGDSFKDLVQPLNRFHQLIFCPGEFEIGNPAKNPYIHFIEPSIRNKNSSTDIFELYNIPRSKKIVYAAMGSQALRHGIAFVIFFNKIIQAMQCEQLNHLHLILAIDAAFDTSNLLPISENITIANWAPQIDILKVASVAVIHGGLGSVKECIYFGVPMIVFPQAFDQPDNAQRVVHHHLGFADDINTVSESDLRNYIMQALTDEKIKNGIERMRRIFHEKEERQEGAAIIESMLAMESSLLI
jgi:MGT family glycosyltransferase